MYIIIVLVDYLSLYILVHIVLVDYNTLIVLVDYLSFLNRIFSQRINTLSALDTEYMSGIPDLYANIDRQFHVNVPCRSKFSRSHECVGPATIVFRVTHLSIS